MPSTPRNLLAPDQRGLRCAVGDFHVDPWRPVATAVITHAHSDHARPGSERYLCVEECVAPLRHRLGSEARIDGVPRGEQIALGDTLVSFHPAGHVLGSAQVRIERGVGIERAGGAGGVWVVTGDCKRQPDPTCAPFEVVPCDTLVIEATFALPIYRWPPIDDVIDELLEWWKTAASTGRTAVVGAYSLGKSQRLLGELARRERDASQPLPGPIFLHGAIVGMTDVYRAQGVRLVPTEALGDRPRAETSTALVIAPPSALASPWMRRLADPATAIASGWMRVRGVRRRRGVERGLVLSDHVDWDDLLRTVDECGCSRVLTTHGHDAAIVRSLNERGIEASALRTQYVGDPEDEDS